MHCLYVVKIKFHSDNFRIQSTHMYENLHLTKIFHLYTVSVVIDHTKSPDLKIEESQ